MFRQESKASIEKIIKVYKKSRKFNDPFIREEIVRRWMRKVEIITLFNYDLKGEIIFLESRIRLCECESQ